MRPFELAGCEAARVARQQRCGRRAEYKHVPLLPVVSSLEHLPLSHATGRTRHGLAN